MIDPLSGTAIAIKAWAEKGLADCTASLLKTETTWDEVVGLRREIKRLRKLVQLVVTGEVE